MSPWEIWYTDESSIKDNDPILAGDITTLPVIRRVGVHSIIQPFDAGRMREVIEQYHYLHLIDEDKWMGVGLDGYLEQMVTQFNNIDCVLNGRTMTTDHFFRLRQTIRASTYIVGGLEASEVARHWEEQRAYFSGAKRNAILDNDRTDQAFLKQDWSDYGRHRMYPASATDLPILGEQNQFPRWVN